MKIAITISIMVVISMFGTLFSSSAATADLILFNH